MLGCTLRGTGCTRCERYVLGCTVALDGGNVPHLEPHILGDVHIRHQEVERVHCLPVLDEVRVACGDHAADYSLHDRPDDRAREQSHEEEYVPVRTVGAGLS